MLHRIISFSTIKNFISAYEHYKNLPQENWDAGELYIAPIYNYLISNGIKVYYTEINKSDVIFVVLLENMKICKEK